MLSYNLFAFDYILPVLITLWWLTRPFLTNLDRFKIKILFILTVFISFINNYIFYCKESVRRYDTSVNIFDSMAVAKYLCISLQIIITSLWTFFCTRWTFHSFYLSKPSHIAFYFTRYFGIIVLAALIITGLTNGSSELKCLCGYLLGISCVWFFAGQYIYRRFPTIAISVIVPSLYFYYIDVFVCQNHVRPTNKLSNSITHYFVFNGFIAFCSAAFDKSNAILNLFYPQDQLNLRNNSMFMTNIIDNIPRLIKGLLSDEIELPSEVIEDFKCCLAVLKKTKSAKLLNIWMKLLPSSNFISPQMSV